MDSFEAPNPMRGTSFMIDDDEDERFQRRISRAKDIRPKDEIKDMIEQITQRMKYFESMYKRAKSRDDRNDMIIALRNFKALEGARQALRWTLKDPDVEIVLY
jgi:hypothetical protein